jgi:hypothetical protein
MLRPAHPEPIMHIHTPTMSAQHVSYPVAVTRRERKMICYWLGVCTACCGMAALISTWAPV